MRIRKGAQRELTQATQAGQLRNKLVHALRGIVNVVHCDCTQQKHSLQRETARDASVEPIGVIHKPHVWPGVTVLGDADPGRLAPALGCETRCRRGMTLAGSPPIAGTVT
jgi:hypothetical protein